MLVAQNLKLDVAGALDNPFQVDGAVAKGGLGFVTGGGDGGRQLCRRADKAHALTATPGCRLDQQWIANAPGRGL